MLTFQKILCYNSITDREKEVSYGALAQLGERHVCTVEVSGSIPLCSTILNLTSGNRSFYFIKITINKKHFNYEMFFYSIVIVLSISKYISSLKYSPFKEMKYLLSSDSILIPL